MLVHHRRTCLELVRLLAQRGMVRFTLEPKERVGLFAVRKNVGLKQRLIVDARRSNLRVPTMFERGSPLERRLLDLGRRS